MKFYSLIPLAAALALTGCLSTKTVVRTEYIMVPAPAVPAPATPAGITTRDLQWRVLTRAELQNALLELEKNPDPDFALFALTPKGFENLALNMNELKRYIEEQKQVIAYYKRATRPQAKKTGAITTVPTPTVRPKS